MHDVLSGMAYMGDHQFIHRDLAARNILVSISWVAKIGDFGLSRGIGGNALYYYMPSSSNSPIPIRWTAPEAIVTSRFTAASDVYAFGVLAYELFTHADLPFRNCSNTSVMAIVLSIVDGSDEASTSHIIPLYHSFPLSNWCQKS